MLVGAGLASDSAAAMPATDTGREFRFSLAQ